MAARALAILPCYFLLSAASPSPLDVNEAGRVMATLNDWRALMFVMLAVVVVQLGGLLWAFGKIAKAVEVMATLREAISALSGTARSAGSDAQENRNALQGIIATISRIEAEIARLE